MPASKIIYGTAWKTTETTSLVIKAVTQGFRAIDTAGQLKHYREDLVGEALRILYSQHGFKREDLWLQTKYTPIESQDPERPIPYDPNASITDQIQSSFQKSLSNLGTNQLDSYIMHDMLDTKEQNIEAWDALTSLKKEAKVKLIGVSNIEDLALLKQLHERNLIDVVQNPWYIENGWDQAISAFCVANNIMYQAFGTIRLSPQLVNHPTVQGIANSKRCSREQVVLRFVQLKGLIPLSGTKSDQHMKDDLQVEHVNISIQEYQSLEEALKEVKLEVD